MAKEYSQCIYCGNQIPADANACPYCGSDEETGWSEETYMDGVDLDDGFDYEEAIEREFGEGKKQNLRLTLKGVIALVVLIAFLLLVFRIV